LEVDEGLVPQPASDVPENFPKPDAYNCDDVPIATLQENSFVFPTPEFTFKATTYNTPSPRPTLSQKKKTKKTKS